VSTNAYLVRGVRAEAGDLGLGPSGCGHGLPSWRHRGAVEGVLRKHLVLVDARAFVVGSLPPEADRATASERGGSGMRSGFGRSVDGGGGRAFGAGG